MLALDGKSLTLEDVVAVAHGRNTVTISNDGIARMAASRRVVDEALLSGQPVYALNTGVGLLANIRLNASEIEEMQVNLVRSHCCGVGEPLPTPVVRGLMLIRANVLAKGFSGIRPIIAERICDLLNHGITPVIPSRGSVGASGDLAPLAHMALTLIGEGNAEYQGKIQPAIDCLQQAGLEPLRLQAKEGISLLNGTQAMLSIGCLQPSAAPRLPSTHVCTTPARRSVSATAPATSSACSKAAPSPARKGPEMKPKAAASRTPTASAAFRRSTEPHGTRYRKPAASSKSN
jgi:histidine ammonia-lyase